MKLVETRYVVKAVVEGRRFLYYGSGCKYWGNDASDMARKYGWRTESGARKIISKLPKVATANGLRNFVEVSYEVIPVYFYKDGEGDYAITLSSYEIAHH